MMLVFGLGNPGTAYRNSRHNAGYLALEELSGKIGIPISKKKFNAGYGEGQVNGEKVLLIEPHTFMNNSGVCVLDFASFYKVPSQSLLVIYDDVDLPPGVIRVRESGGAGTHNGMRDILSKIHTEDFPRVRIGTGAPPPEWDMADYVLSRPVGEEEHAFKQAVSLAAEAVQHSLQYGVASAMRYNGKSTE
jgi:PTH1 family peptidyl-tRNA hydrolase